MDRLTLSEELSRLESEHGKLQQIAASLESFCRPIDADRRCDGCDPLVVGECADAIANTLSVLNSLAMRHFDREERIMKLVCPPNEIMQRFGAHIGDHAAVAAELARMSAQPASLPCAVMIDKLLAVTRRWLNEHIATHDQALLQFIEAPRK